MYKKILYLCFVVALFITMHAQTIMGGAAKKSSFSDVTQNYSWAYEAIDALTERGVLVGIDGKNFAPGASVTKEQFTKMLVLALDIKLPEKSESSEDNPELEPIEETKISYRDVEDDRWSFDYIQAAKDYLYDDSFGANKFYPEENYSREKCAYAVSMALGIGAEKNLLDQKVISKNFKDGDKITKALSIPVAIAAERGIVKGADRMLRPEGEVTRAEAAVILHRAMQYKERNSQGLFITETPMLGESTVTVEQAKKWAQNQGAHQRFIDVADLYWKYGELTGIRPEILYGQAAKETAYGKYTGQVQPEQNNWAGIKIKNPTGDKPEDHETFLTPEDGVRAHFNHMSQYVGVEPVGEPHDRYYVLNTVPWRGTVKNVEQLGGKWAPDVTYGYNIVVKLLSSMQNTK